MEYEGEVQEGGKKKVRKTKGRGELILGSHHFSFGRKASESLADQISRLGVYFDNKLALFRTASTVSGEKSFFYAYLDFEEHLAEISEDVKFHASLMKKVAPSD